MVSKISGELVKWGCLFRALFQWGFCVVMLEIRDELENWGCSFRSLFSWVFFFFTFLSYIPNIGNEFGKSPCLNTVMK